jgi:outer membrane immunogenic protein
MKKTLLFGAIALSALMLAGATQAADLPAKAPVIAAPTTFSWTGLYIGVHVGAGWGTKTWRDAFFDTDTGPGSQFDPGPLGSYNVNGFLGGGQIGYNWQSGWVLFGIEADASWTNLEGGNLCVSETDQCSSEAQALGTITARFGGIFLDRALLYVKGGAAWVHEKHTLSLFFDPPFATTMADTSSHTRWGWTVGTGLEVAFTPNWSGKIEYNYLDFGKKSIEFSYPAADLVVHFPIKQNLHVVKFGLNYRWSAGAPLVARY